MQARDGNRTCPAGPEGADMKRLGLLAVAMLGAIIGAFSLATPGAALDRPSGPVILTVTGAITHTNDGDRAVFDRALLERLGKAKIKTTTVWTDGVNEFEGVPVKTLLDAVGRKGHKLRAMAINDYTIELDAREFDTVPALLATKMNGVELKVRDKGPIWLVFPRDDFPAFRSESNNFKWIWQLKTITVQ